ncbi:MAG: aminopeptidase [Anaerolineales bacterium]
MPDPRVINLANVLVNYSTKVQPGDWVQIVTTHAAMPLVNELYKAILAAGGYPAVMFNSDQLAETYLAHANDEQLKWANPAAQLMIEQVDVLMSVRAPENTRALSGIDPKRQQAQQIARKEWIDVYRKRSASGDLRWNITNYPCLALAQEADMSLSDYENFIFRATFADQDDPVAEWERIHAEQQHKVDWLAGKKTFEIKGAHADLTMSIEGRPFINSAGDKNMPSGEVFTSPVEGSINGWVEFTYPVIHLGREVEGVRLEFKDGKVVKATAEKNEDYLIQVLDTDEGARYLGELGIGTNFGIDRFTKDILYDEKIGGSFHLAVGSGFAQIGGKNESIIHWDMICDAREDTEMLVDGELFYKNGKFMV